jgi:Tol biopolymer transport system component
MISRVVLGVALTVVMVVTGVSTYVYIGTRHSKVTEAPLKPTAAEPTPHQFVLPGTLYVVQNGALYSLNAGRYRQITSEAGWMEPALVPDGNLVIVRRQGFFSDVFEINVFGRTLRQMTNNQAPRRSYDTGDNHWSFYPSVSPDGRTLYMSYDKPKYGYEVDLSVWSMPFNGSLASGTVWSDEYADPGYTGGDVQPLAVPGGVIYTRYDRNYDGSIASQIWYTNRPGSYGKAWTSLAEDCREPSIAPGGGWLAMICTYNKQISYLVIAPFAGPNLGARRILISDQMVAQPTWAPDGSGIAYLAPVIGDQPFQLWFLPRAAYFPPEPSPSPTPTPIPGGPVAATTPSPSPSPTPAPVIPPIQMSTSLAFDATSTLAWAS